MKATRCWKLAVGKSLAWLALGNLLLASARAVDLDFSNAAVGPNKTFATTSADKVAAAQLYDVFFTNGAGTSTGSFSTAFGDGNAETLLNQLQAGAASEAFTFTLANLSGKLPASFWANHLVTRTFAAIPIGNGVTAATVKVSVSMKLAINASGVARASYTSKFTAKNAKGKALPMSGAFTLSSGTLAVRPAVATSETPQPNLLVLSYPVRTFGNNIVDTNGSQNVTFLRLKRGHSGTQYLIVKNNGPAADGFLLSGLPAKQFLPKGITTKVFDGKKDITAEVYSANSYAVKTADGADLPSGGTKVIKLVIHASASAALTSIFNPNRIALKLRRTADSSNFTVAGDSVIVLK